MDNLEISIKSVAKAQVITIEDNVVDCSMMRKMCGFSSASVCLSADGQTWSETINLSQSSVKDLCAMQIKVIQGSVVIRS